MKKYEIKPYEVEAIQWTGENKEEIESFCKKMGNVIKFVEKKLYLKHMFDLNWVPKTSYIVFRPDKYKIGMYDEEHFHRKFREV